jgi:TRAP transporter TAXI family solute receptor
MAMVGLSRRQALGLAAGAGIFPSVAIRRARAQEPRFFRIATGPTESSLFQVGALIGQVVSSPPGSRECDRGGSCGVPGLIAVTQTTAGSAANVDLIKTRRMDSGLCRADLAYWAFNGTGPYRLSGAVANLRAIASLYPEAVHVVVRRDSGISDLAGLRGKRVALGEQDSSVLASARAVLDAAGVPESALRTYMLAPAVAADALREGQLDAFFEVAGVPSAVVADLAVHLEVALLPMSDAVLQRLREGAPFVTRTAITADSYNGMAEVASAAVGLLWVVQAEAEQEIVLGLTRALFNPGNRRALDATPLGHAIALETALDGIAFPLHPGAAQFYLEAGVDAAAVRRLQPS